MKPYIVDNFLSKEDFKKIVDIVSGPDINWHYSYSVADGSKEEDDMYFIHMLYMGLAEMPKDGVMPPPPKNSDYYHFFGPLFAKLPNFKLLMRAKINLYGRTPEIVHHPDHVDMKQEHMGALFSLNTCDGGTVIGDEKFDSVANRILFFDPTQPHHSTSTTDVKRRLNVNINYL
tara:strand:+ start:318 stop:839 length:522 start_codon:yes stop_codon:yes gene_type:complete